MANFIYTMQHLSKIVHPNRHILKDISLSFIPGAKIGVLGINGSGKSTLLRIMAGEDKEFIGEAMPKANIKIGYLPQEPQLDPNKDVRGNVEEGVKEIKALLTRFDEVNMSFGDVNEEEMNKLLEEQGELQSKIELAGAWDLDHKLERAADALRLPAWDADVTKLSGGERRRVALCRLLLSSPDMLLLDEPTNHLDAESVNWLEAFLHSFAGTVVAITHDRYFLDNAAQWILELDRGVGIPYKGNYTSWLEQKEQRLLMEGKQQAAHERTVKAELEWVRNNAKGQRTKNKARLQRFQDLNSEEFQKRNETNEIYIAPGQRLGDVVIEADNISKSFGDRLLFENLSFRLPPGGILGVIGANGAGKSTLLRMITGAQEPDSGTLRIGDTVNIAYVDQMRDHLEPNKTVWEEISGGQDIMLVGKVEIPSRAYCGKFNFKGTDQQKRVGELSGGERNRVHLAKLLRSGGNVLLLDEPSNDLDVETLRALEEALLAFPGSAIVISHDRWFLDRVATHILAFEDEGECVFIEGNFQDYHADRRRRLGDEADNPRRAKFKKLK